MKRKKLALVAVSLALGFGAAAGAARSGLLGTLAIGGKGRPAASGIRVHGKWSLVVRNTHGKVVARRRFENALTTDGAGVLASLLLGGVGDGAATVGGQGIVLDDGSTPGTGCQLVITTNLCSAQHNDGYGVSNTFVVPDDSSSTGSLHVAYSASPSPTVTLSGSIAPPVDVTFTAVRTQIKTCNWTTESDDCGPKTSGGFTDYDTPVWRTFTSKTLGQALHVLHGQSVAVTVKLTFS